MMAVQKRQGQHTCGKCLPQAVALMVMAISCRLPKITFVVMWHSWLLSLQPSNLLGVELFLPQKGGEGET